MNHIPDTVLTDIDAFGEQALRGQPSRVDGTLRSDLQIVIIPKEDGQTATVQYETVHTQRPSTLRERGSFVATIVDGIDARLESWGVIPPEAYRYTSTTGETHTYTGCLNLP